MKRNITILLILFSTLILQAQVQTLWQRTSINNNMPSWFSTGNTERGFTYWNNRLYVVSRTGGTFVKILSATTGVDLGEMRTIGIAGGTFALNDIEATSDGYFYGCNLVNDAAGIFKIYLWKNETDTPKVVFESDFGGDKRFGDNFTIIGNAGNRTMSLWCCDQKNSAVYVLAQQPTGDNLIIVRTIQLPASTFGSVPNVVPLPEDSMIVVKSAGRYIEAYDYNGALKDFVPGTIAGTGSTSTRIMDLNERGFIATFQYPTVNVRILDTQGEVGAHFRTFAATDAFGSNGNANGTGDIAFQYPGDGSVNMFVLGTNNGIIAYKITTPMAVNGRFHEKYTMMAESQNNNRGFGENIYVKRLAYTIANDKLYLALESRLDKTNDNGIVVFLNVNKLAGQGAPAGTALGAVTGLGHVLGNTANPNFKNDFETHFAFVINPGGADSMVYVDGAKYTTSTKIGQYLGKAKQDGSGAFGPEVAGVFTANSINFAFDSAYGGGRGWEIAIPLSEIGNPTAVNQISAFAAVVSSTAYFSNVTVPGNAGTSNPGFNPNFQTMSGGPFHSVGVPVPVELTSFTYQVIGLQIQLQWKTASEKNNRGFEIQRSFDGSSFERIGFIPGSGTTTEQIAYSFVDKPALNETIYYRLKQIDFDGSTNYSNVISVDFNSSPSVFALEQNYPNPFNPSTMIRFSVNKNLPTTLKIYDVLGVEVASLFDGIAKAGESYQLQFNAVNVPSGVYFYSLRQADNTITRRMLLLK